MNRIQGARFLVTGGAGFVGSTIVDQLLDAGAAEVRVLDNFIRGTWSNLSSALETGRGEPPYRLGNERDPALALRRLARNADPHPARSLRTLTHFFTSHGLALLFLVVSVVILSWPKAKLAAPRTRDMPSIRLMIFFI